MMDRRCSLFLALLSACGAEAQPSELRISFPAYLALGGCSMTTQVRESLQAVLEVGGENGRLCALALDRTTLTSSGTCTGIMPGMIRPLGLGYWVPESGSSGSLAMAYIIGWVDLRPEVLEPDSMPVPISLDPDGTHAIQVDTNYELSNLATAEEAEQAADPNEQALMRAEAWAAGQLSTVNFDRDGDGSSNLVEACQGSPF